MHLVVCVVHTVVVALVCTVVLYTGSLTGVCSTVCVYSTYILGNETHVVCCNDLERYMLEY